MKHAGDSALDSLESILAELRALDGMVEKKRGVFYHKPRGASARQSQAFLHFHEDPAGFFADVRSAAPGVSDAQGWQRLPANTASQRKALVATVRRVLGASSR